VAGDVKIRSGMGSFTYRELFTFRTTDISHIYSTSKLRAPTRVENIFSNIIFKNIIAFNLIKFLVKLS
jgi:hypothetical protein